MPDRMDPETREALRKESEEAHRRALEIVRKRATEDQLRRDWDQLRGTHLKPYGSKTSRSSFWSELWTFLCLSPEAKAVAFAAFVLITGSLVYVYPWGERSFQGAGGVASGLPPKLQLNVRSSRLELADAGTKLSGAIDSATRAANNNTTSFDVDLAGTNARGERVLFKGTVVLTNAPQVQVIKGSSEVIGVLLKGRLTVGNAPGTDIEQGYVP